MRRLFKNLAIGVVVALILFGAVGCAKESPEQALKKMIQAMARAEACYAEIKVWVNGQFPQLTSLNLDEAKFYPGTIIIDLKGDMGFRKNLEFALNGLAKYRLLDSEIEFNGDTIYQDGALYLKLSKVPSLKLVDLSSVKNNWYKFDFAAVGLASGLSESAEKLNDKKNQRLRKLVEDTEFFDIVSDEGIDVVNYEESRKFTVKIKQERMFGFMKKLTEIMDEREISAEEEAALKNNLAKLNDVEFRVWVARKSYRLARLEFGLPLETKEHGALRYDVVLNFSGYNQVINIEKPKDVRDFNMLEIFSGAGAE
ncbi:hypothetical protein HZB94_03180 [Candidatus Falkowbacteria bacterium]|nr:hypothetical protein [Candidatus Falkowbacteria bacterium]